MKFSAAIATEGGPNDPVLFQGDPLKAAQILQESGVEAMEIHTPDALLLDRKALISYCQKTGMKISALATGLAKRKDGLSLIHEDKTVREAAIQRILDFIQVAHEIGAENIILGSIRGQISPKSNRLLKEFQLSESLSILTNFAEVKKVTLLLEVINRYENNYLNTARETFEFLIPLPSDYLKIHLDTFHMNIEENNMESAVSLCGSRLGYLHLADNTRCHPGSGSIPFDKVIKAAQKIGYQGYFSLECFPVPDGRTAILNTIKALNKIN